MRRDVILARGVRVAEHTTTIDDVPVLYRSAEVPPGQAPVLYLHDALMSSADLVPFLERTGGLAPDLIGFGRSGKGGHLDYSPSGLVDFLERFVDQLSIERTGAVGHGWGGALGLLLALRRPGLVERFVLIDAVPLLDGFVWQGPARVWRRRAIGELVMGSISRRMLARELRRGSATPNAWTTSRVAEVWEDFDQGTQRALLRLHRAADEAHLAELGTGLESLDIPALVIWGDADPWFAPRFADAYGTRLRDARVEHIADAGHWPWLDQPRVLEAASQFLTAP